MNQTQRNVFITIGVIVLLLILLPMAIFQIDAGSVGVKLRNGALAGTIGEGLHFKLPVFENIVRFEARTQKKEVYANAATRDLQQIDATIALNYRIDATRVEDIYKELGIQYEDRVVIPRLQESVKTVTAKFTAEELITKRPQVREQILAEIKGKLESDNILVEDVSIVNLGFSPEFTKAIEEKQLAAQRVLTAQNDLERIKIEGQQQITKATADAEAQRLQQSTLNDLLLQKQFIEKWNGVLPVYVGAQTGILDLRNYTK